MNEKKFKCDNCNEKVDLGVLLSGRFFCKECEKELENSL